MNQENGFLGTGWSFPVRVDNRGGIARSHGEADIEEAIRVVLGTAPGERRMRPQFGCAIHDQVFAPNNATTAGLVAHHVEEALGWWEPRIEVLAVNVSQDPQEPARLLIDIHYAVRATNEERNLVYPFYRIPEER